MGGPASPPMAGTMSLRALLRSGDPGWVRALVEVKDGVAQDVPRQITTGHFVKVQPQLRHRPGTKLVVTSRKLQDLLGIDAADDAAEYEKLLTGAELVEGCEPWATAYGCHHAGSYMGQMGDGRAMSITRVPTPRDPRHANYEIQLKGCGRTPFNRTFDGRCVLRSCVREFLMSEFMHAAGVPTTRALAVVATGEHEVHRPWFPEGSAQQRMMYEVGAVTCRVAPNFLRFGHVCYFHEIGRLDLCQQILAAANAEVFNTAPPADLTPLAPEQFVALFDRIAEASADLVAHWMRIGYVHGNMNSDNMSLMGLSLDYGPFGMMGAYDPHHCPWHSARRYAYRFQPEIMHVNVAVLARAVVAALAEAHGSANEHIEHIKALTRDWPGRYRNKWAATVMKKLGLTDEGVGGEADGLFAELANLMEVDEADYTTIFRCLADVTDARKSFEVVKPAFLDPQSAKHEAWELWLAKYAALPRDVAVMKATNPTVVLHNYMATQAYEAAINGDYGLVRELHELLETPYADAHRTSRWFGPVPEEYADKPGVAVMS